MVSPALPSLPLDYCWLAPATGWQDAGANLCSKTPKMIGFRPKTSHLTHHRMASEMLRLSL